MNKHLLITIITSVIIFVLSFLFVFDLVVIISDYLDSIGVTLLWSVNSTAMSIALAILPVISFMTWKKTRVQTTASLLWINTYVILCVAIFILLAFFIADILPNPRSSPLLPDYVETFIFQPFPLYWELSIWMGAFVPMVIVWIISRHRSRKAAVIISDATLDQVDS